MQKKIYCHSCGGPLIEKFWEGSIRPFCRNCNEPIYENPVPATAVVVAGNDQSILLVKRSVAPKVGMWCLPGGFMELGETPEQSALRELKEETGISGKISDLLGVASNTSPRYHTVLLIGYLVKHYSGTLVPGDDAAEAAYFPLDALPEIAFESHKKFIRIYHAGYLKI